ncbi:hypothetical protein HMI56_003843 [Coelomomyces lativittatus]|nr:hypothetical protein HMI56_003843 [Coelomomyces lativittatus]
MRKGEVIETGTHEELLKRQGYYHQLVRDQQVELEEDEDDDEDDEAVEGNQVKQGVEGNDVTQATNATNRPPSGSPKAEMRVSRMSVDKRSSIGSKNSLLTKNVTIDDEVPLEVSPFTRAVKLNKSQWKWIVLGVFGAIIAGSVTPAYALIYSQAITSFSASFMLVNGEKVPNVDELNYQGSLWGGTFLGIALAAGISNYLQITSFIVSGEVLVLKMRSELFKAVLRQEISFFDRDENAVGTLASKLSLRASLLRNLVGDAMGTVVQVFMSIVVGSAIALATAWQLALVVLAFAPFIMLSGVVQGRILNGLGDKNIENKASKLASEVVSNVRTVASLGLENKFLQEYHSLLEAPKKLGLKEALIGAIVFGLSSCIIFITYGTAFIYAAKLIVWGTYRFEQVFRAIATIGTYLSVMISF